jgi:predicted CoA-binding protein
MNDPKEIRRALERARTIAVIGCSPNPARPSHSVAGYLQEAGYRIVPVNPGHREILGETCYPSLAEIPRRSGSTSWTCSGDPSTSRDASQAIGGGRFRHAAGVGSRRRPEAEAAGIPVAMDRCLAVEHGRRGRAAAEFIGLDAFPCPGRSPGP